MIVIANNKLIKLNIIDSSRNCLINWNFPDPDTFLIPISCALFEDRAVDKLIKFMQPISRDIKEIMAREYIFL